MATTNGDTSSPMADADADAVDAAGSGVPARVAARNQDWCHYNTNQY